MCCFVSFVVIINKKIIKKIMVENIGEKYICRICGNEVEVLKVGGGTLVCCGQDMELMENG